MVRRSGELEGVEGHLSAGTWSSDISRNLRVGQISVKNRKIIHSTKKLSNIELPWVPEMITRTTMVHLSRNFQGPMNKPGTGVFTNII